jgi:hypothetical protein
MTWFRSSSSHHRPRLDLAFTEEQLRGLATFFQQREVSADAAAALRLSRLLDPQHWPRSRQAIAGLRALGARGLWTAPELLAYIKLAHPQASDDYHQYTLHEAGAALAAVRRSRQEGAYVLGSEAAFAELERFLDGPAVLSLFAELLQAPVRICHRGYIACLEPSYSNLDVAIRALDAFLELPLPDSPNESSPTWHDYTAQEAVRVLVTLSERQSSQQPVLPASRAADAPASDARSIIGLDRTQATPTTDPSSMVATVAQAPSTPESPTSARAAQATPRQQSAAVEPRSPKGASTATSGDVKQRLLAYAQAQLNSTAPSAIQAGLTTLSQLGSAAAQCQSALLDLLERLQSSPEGPSVEALRNRTLQVLAGCAAHGALDGAPSDREEAASPALTELLRLATEDAEASVRVQALDALRSAQGPAAALMVAAVKASRDPDGEVRAAAARLLGMLCE